MIDGVETYLRVTFGGLVRVWVPLQGKFPVERLEGPIKFIRSLGTSATIALLIITIEHKYCATLIRTIQDWMSKPYKL